MNKKQRQKWKNAKSASKEPSKPPIALAHSSHFEWGKTLSINLSLGDVAQSYLSLSLLYMQVTAVRVSFQEKMLISFSLIKSFNPILA